MISVDLGNRIVETRFKYGEKAVWYYERRSKRDRLTTKDTITDNASLVERQLDAIKNGQANGPVIVKAFPKTYFKADVVKTITCVITVVVADERTDVASFTVSCDNRDKYAKSVGRKKAMQGAMDELKRLGWDKIDRSCIWNAFLNEVKVFSSKENRNKMVDVVVVEGLPNCECQHHCEGCSKDEN